MKKLSSTLLIILIALLSLSICIKSNEIPFSGANYEEIEIVQNNSLAFGVVQKSIKGESGLVDSSLDPQNINVIDVPNDDNLEIVTWAKISNSRWNMAPVRTIAEDYELNNPGYKVIAAINGDFFDINGKQDFPYATAGIHVSGGENYKTTDNDAGTSREPIAFNNLLDNRIIGNESYIRSENMIITVYDGINQSDYIVDNVNVDPLDNETSVYYGLWKDRVPEEIAVQNAYIIEDAIYSLPHSIDDFYGKGIITSYGNKTIGEGDFAISTNNQELKDLLEVGKMVRIQYQLEGEFSDVLYATGAGKPIIYNSEYQADDTTFGTARHPRTMIGVKADGTTVMMVVDGRQTNMTGVSQKEMAAIMSHYGAVEAYNLDGGGSSTMLILKDGDFQVVNSPSDNRERSVSNAILVVAKVPNIKINMSEILDNQIVLSSELINLNGYTFDDYYIGINDNIVKVENNSAVFSGLNSNTEYTYVVYYKDDDEYIALPIESRVTSAKKMPYLDNVSFTYNNYLLTFQINIIDIDSAIDRRILTIDNKNYTISDEGVIYISKFNGDLRNIQIKLGYNLNDNNGKFDLVYDEYKLILNLHSYFYYTNNINERNIKKIFN